MTGREGGREEGREGETEAVVPEPVQPIMPNAFWDLKEVFVDKREVSR